VRVHADDDREQRRHDRPGSREPGVDGRRVHAGQLPWPISDATVVRHVYFLRRVVHGRAAHRPRELWRHLRARVQAARAFALPSHGACFLFLPHTHTHTLSPHHVRR
jgi:hypothetical protein